MAIVEVCVCDRCGYQGIKRESICETRPYVDLCDPCAAAAYRSLVGTLTSLQRDMIQEFIINRRLKGPYEPT